MTDDAGGTATEQETIDALRRYGWLRLNEWGEEVMHRSRDTSDEAMERYRAYAERMKGRPQQ